jgi:heat shock protein HslJ
MLLAAAPALTSILVVSTLIAQTPPAVESETVIPPLVWELVEMTASRKGPLEIAGPERYSVQFQTNDTVSARAGCNRVAGTYSAGDSVLDISLSVSTLALCPSDTHGEPFLELLDGATTFEINPDGFMILSGKAGQLRFRPSLTGVVWEWQDLRGGDDSFVAPSRPADYTLTFMPDGKLAIQTGCVRALGTYATDGSALEIAVNSSSQAECGPGALAERFLRDLGEVSSHVFRDGNLYLALRTDAGILAFAARYEASPATPQASPVSAEPA